MLIRRFLSKNKENWPKQPLIFLRYQSLSFAVSRCHSLYQSLSFVVTSYHSLSLDVSLVWHFINDLTKKAFSLVLIIIKKTKENEMINDSTSEWVSEWVSDVRYSINVPIAVPWRCSIKKMLLETFGKLTEDQGLQQKCFSLNMAKFLRFSIL